MRSAKALFVILILNVTLYARCAAQEQSRSNTFRSGNLLPTFFSEFLDFPAPTRSSPETRTAVTFRPTTRPSIINENEFVQPNCYAQPNCASLRDRKYSLVSGICNNLIDGNRGRVGRSYKRLLPPDYGDKSGTPRLGKNGKALPSARKISLSLNLDDRQAQSTTISRMMPWWGQFITHETTKALRDRKPSGATFSCTCENPEIGCHNIELSKTDIRYIEEAELCIEVERTEAVPNPVCDSSIREQKNSVSSYLDAGTVYGDSESDFDQLLDYRSDIGELLKGSYGDADGDDPLPLQSQVHRDFGGRVQCEAAIHKPPSRPCLLAGDTRANENTALSAAHVVLLRKHNEIVKKLSVTNPGWSRITLAQETRKIITAIQQHITYHDFIPAILGNKYIKRFDLAPAKTGYWHGYDPTVDATLSNSFAAAAFRFGHTTLTKFLSRTSPDWRTPEAQSLRVKDTFFNNEPLLEQFQGGVNSVLRGLAKDATQLTGTKMVEDLREFLFAVKGRPGKDLFAINIQRGRDHGIPGYNEFRELCGLNRAKNFAELTEIPKILQDKLTALYEHVDDIDLYVGGLAERIDGGALGPTYACIIGYQFRDLRYGDRFWYENGNLASSFSPEQLTSITEYSLARLLCDTMSDLRSIQPRPMQLASVAGNFRRYCGEYPELDLRPWKDNFQSSKRRRGETEWSPWFPCVNDAGDAVPVAAAISDALRFRERELCRHAISTETRVINSVTQVRVECPRGSIRRTDFPYIDSGYDVYWTSWKDDSDPTDGDDEELPPDTAECARPLAIQVQTVKGVPAGETGQVFEVFHPDYGFRCRGKHQTTPACEDYRIRYLCRKGIGSGGDSVPSDKKPKVKSQPCAGTSSPTAATLPSTTSPQRNRDDLNKILWTPWSNFDNPSGDGDNELVSNIAGRPGFCRQPRRICQDYEVRYLCRSGDINVAVPPGVVETTKQYCRSFGVCC